MKRKLNEFRIVKQTNVGSSKTTTPFTVQGRFFETSHGSAIATEWGDLPERFSTKEDAQNYIAKLMDKETNPK